MLTLDSVSLRYRNGHHAVDGIDLVAPATEITVVIGGSGCGKSTLLRLVAGLERPTTGTVTVSDHPVEGPSADVGVVFQEPRLMPWLKVADNVGFGLDHLDRAEAAQRIDAALTRVGLSEFAHALPRQLSGGMAQRTALARALVAKPDVMLLDEPFSALDALTRRDLQQHLLDLWAADRQTLLLVTHDIDEALLLADTIVVMAGQPGRIVEQVTVPTDRPRTPTNRNLIDLRQHILDLLKAKPAAMRENSQD
jgi:sulfonate transport system ATP-binding protein